MSTITAPKITAGRIVAALGTITADTKVIDATVTWNSGGVTFTAWKLNVTDTASAAASLLADLQVGGSSKWKLQKDGTVTMAGALTGATSVAVGTGGLTIGTMAAATLALVATGNDQANARLRVTNSGTSGKSWSFVAGNPGTNNSDWTLYNETDGVKAVVFSPTGTATFVGVIRNDGLASGIAIGSVTGVVRIQRSSDTIQLLNSSNAAAAVEVGTLTATSVTTAAPAGSSAAAWKLGAANVVSPTSPNRTIAIDIAGTVYYLHAKTTND